MSTTPLYLEVPYTDHATARKAGARWDRARESWYIQPEVPVDYYTLRPWIPIETCTSGHGTEVAIVGIVMACPRCGEDTLAVAGVEEPGEGIATPSEFTLKIALKLWGRNPPVGVGRLEQREIRRGRSQLCNVCTECDAALSQDEVAHPVSLACLAGWREFIDLDGGAVHPLVMEAAYAYGATG